MCLCLSKLEENVQNFNRKLRLGILPAKYLFWAWIIQVKFANKALIWSRSRRLIREI